MKLNNKDYDEILTIIIQCKTLLPKLDYNEELEKIVFDCMKKQKNIEKKAIQRCHNNYLALCILGLNYCDSDTFKKLDEYMKGY